MYAACQYGHQAVARLLLDRGAVVNQAKVRGAGGEGHVICGCVRVMDDEG